MFGPGNCSDQITACKATGNNTICSDADSFCATNVEAVYDNVLNRDEYDVRELIDPSTGADPFPPTFYVEYLNTATVQAAIGAYVNFSESNPTVNDAFVTTGDDGREDNTVEDMRALIEQNITVVMYTGDADYNCNWLGGEAVSIEIDAPGFSSAGYTNITTSDGVIHGQVKQAGKFSFVRIYESGHEVPFYQVCHSTFSSLWSSTNLICPIASRCARTIRARDQWVGSCNRYSRGDDGQRLHDDRNADEHVPGRELYHSISSGERHGHV